MTTSRETTWTDAQKIVHDADGNAVRSAYGLLQEIRKEGPGMDGWPILESFQIILDWELRHRGIDFRDIADHFHDDPEGG